MAKTALSVGVKRDLPQLLDGGRFDDADAAVAGGTLFREKIHGNWVYGTSSTAVAEARKQMADVLELTLTDWLLGILVMVAGNARQRVYGIEVSPGAAQQLTKELLRVGAVQGLGLLTQANQPYLAVYSDRDEREIDRQLQAVVDRLLSHGVVTQRDLPDPAASRELDAWRGVLLQHAEFLGLGWLERGVLRSWQLL